MASPFRSKHSPSTLSTKQCRQIIDNSLSEFTSEQFTDKGQQHWLDNYSEPINEDHLKKVQIKEKLIKQCFSLRKKRRSKEELRKQFALNRNADVPIRRQIESRIRDSLSIVFKERSRTPKTPIFSKRYQNANSITISQCRPLTSAFRSRPARQTNSRDFYSTQIDSIIEQSNKIKKYRTVSTPKVKYPGSKEKEMRRRDLQEKYRIMDKVIKNDIDDYIKSYSIDLKEVNAEKERQKYEDRKRGELTNLQKYNMSFIKFMKQKTNSNIEKAVYHQKIRQKNSFVQKFQRQLLDEYKLSDQNRSRLQKVFENIEQQIGHCRTRASSSQQSR